MWLDFRAWGMSHEEVFRLLCDKAKLGFNEGSMFGAEGKGFMRMNIATRHSVVVQAMEQLHTAVLAYRPEFCKL